MVKQSTFRELVIADLGMLDYQEAWNLQRAILDRKKAGQQTDYLLLLEHPHTYTLGKVAHREHLLLTDEELKEQSISVYDVDRGGDITYHGPGQLVGYPVIDLKNWKQDSHKYLRSLEEILIKVTDGYGLHSGRKEGLTGVWIEDRKIAAIGVKISSWITMHGFAYNCNPDLRLFSGIVPCGIRDKEVTSLSVETEKEVKASDIIPEIINNFKIEFQYHKSRAIDKYELLQAFEAVRG